MLALALTVLFSTAAALAIGVIADTAWRQRRAVLALHGELERCPEMRIFSYRIISCTPPARPVAQVLALPVRLKASTLRPVPALLAAA